jgi:hypothetical protein
MVRVWDLKSLHIARVGGICSLFFLRMANNGLGRDRYRLECFIVSYLEGRKIIVLTGKTGLRPLLPGVLGMDYVTTCVMSVA